MATLNTSEIKERLGLDVETSGPAEWAARLVTHLKHGQAKFDSAGMKTTN